MPLNNSLLVVEDEVLVARDIKCRLAKMGYDVVGTACRGKQGVEMALETRPNLILMDINLRDDMDGVEAARLIREQYDVPVIFCTAYSNQETLDRAKITEPYGYVLKPFDNRELEINIEVALYKHRMEKNLRETQTKLDATLANVNDAVLATNETGEVYVINPMAEQLTGWSRESIKGENIVDVLNLCPLGENEAAVDFDGLYLDQIDVPTGRHVLTALDGRAIPVEFTATVIDDARTDMVVFTFRDISMQLDFEQQIRHTAFFDDLTDLPNRALFLDRLDSSLNRRKRGNSEEFAVVFLGLDGFAPINEGLGHDQGDALISAVGERIRLTVRPDDTVSRFSGDIFAVLLDPVDSIRGAIQACNRIQRAIEKPMALAGTTVNISASAGIVMHRQGSNETPEVVLRDADTALHRAKLDAKGSYVVFDNEMYKKALKFIEWKSGMQQGIQEGAFEVYYQPIVSAVSEKLVSMEALIRWPHPELGFVPPSEFIPIAEESGLILPLGEWVMRSVAAQIRDWNDEGLRGFRVAVNLSARQFETNVPKMVRGILRESGISADSLGLEITEGIAMKNIDHNIQMLRELAELGLNISIDDFGTGYSSLAYLKRFPLNTLKIDRSFIVDITNNNDDCAITKAIIAMGQNLRLKVLAEGVETDDQVRLLRESGCDYIQGYYYSKPLPAPEVLPYLRYRGLI